MLSETRNPKFQIRILCVENDNDTAKLIEKYLKKFGYILVGVATTGEEAITKFEECKPDLVLMDIQLDGKMDGIETAGKIRLSCETPIIYLTAYSDEKKLERARITEPFGYIIKPFKPKELHANISMALYKHKTEKKLKELNRELLEKEEMKAIMAMAITVNHEINNPLTAITGYAECLLSEKDLSDENKKVLSIIYKQAVKIGKIVKRFTKITKPVKTKYLGNTEMIDLEKSKYNNQ